MMGTCRFRQVFVLNLAYTAPKAHFLCSNGAQLRPQVDARSLPADSCQLDLTPPLPARRRLTAPFGFLSFNLRALDRQRLLRPLGDRVELSMRDECNDPPVRSFAFGSSRAGKLCTGSAQSTCVVAGPALS
jgi:hypothetical protein